MVFSSLSAYKMMQYFQALFFIASCNLTLDFMDFCDRFFVCQPIFSNLKASNQI